MSDLMMRLSELTRDLFAVGSEEDGRTAAEADARIREQRDLLNECEQTLLNATAHLIAAVSLLERGGKKAAPSDKMFSQMLLDYKGSISASRATLAKLRSQEKTDE